MTQNATKTLKQLREMRGLTQAEVARRLAVSQARISKIENSPLGSLEIRTIRDYVKALGGTVKAEIRLGDDVLDSVIFT